MNPYDYRSVNYKTTIALNSNYKNKKGKQAKNWETQYKSIWNGRKR